MDQTSTIVCRLFPATAEPQDFSTVEAAAAALRTELGESTDATTNAAHAVLSEDDTAGKEPLLWIELLSPSTAQLEDLAQIFELPPLAVEDAVEAHQRPKFEHYPGIDFMVLRPARLGEAAPHDPAGRTEVPHRKRHKRRRPTSASAAVAAGSRSAGDSRHSELPQFTVDVGEKHLFIGGHFVIVVRHSDEFSDVRARERFGRDQQKSNFEQYRAVYCVLDEVVDECQPIIDELEDYSDYLEEQIFTGTPATSQDIFVLSRGIIELERSVAPMSSLLHGLAAELKAKSAPSDLLHVLRDVADHSRAHAEHLERLRSLLREIFSANATMISEQKNALSIQQNDQMKKISAWAGIMFFPSLVAANYGMNFDRMPELHWLLGYPFAIAIMVLGCLVLWRIFKKVDWL